MLYNEVLNISPETVCSPTRDRFVLSKGHGGAVVYAALAEKGFFRREELLTYYKNGSRLSGHISHKNVPGVEVSTGSLGQGVCVATGFALAAKKQKLNYRVFTVVGDGETNEGSVWETAFFAAQQKLDNFIMKIDRNRLQAMGFTSEIIKNDNLCEKFTSFGWNSVSVDGHNLDMLRSAFNMKTDKPLCVVAETIKGKGVSFMENNLLWHYRDPQGEFYDRAAEEIGGQPL